MNEIKININLPAIKNIAIKGVRRTAVFMGLGINAANNPDFKQYELTQITNFEFIEPISDEKTLNNFKTEFGRWIVINGLRELIETFCVFLDEIHLACLFVALTIGQIPKDRFQSQNMKFRHYGLNDKFTHLNNDFNVSIKLSDYLVSINQARHCLTHRRGIVGIEDCLNRKELIVRWKGIDIYAETPSGEKISLLPLPEERPILIKGSEVKLEFQEHSKIFPLKSIVTFSPRDLAEICNFTLMQINEINRSTLEYAKNSGIPVTEPEATQNDSK